MTIEIKGDSVPESPFKPRPQANSTTSPAVAAGESKPSSEASSGESVSSSTASPVSAHARISWPLTSFESTPHNVACIAFLLGISWSLGLYLSSSLIWSNAKWIAWTTKRDGGELALGVRSSSSLASAFKSPVLGVYLSAWSIFHMLEFVVTSMWNPGKLSVSSFLLDNGNAYHVAHMFGILEHVLEEAFLPDSLRTYKHQGGIILLGFILIIGGQILRSFAMITASSNFSHMLAFKKAQGHQLVTNGIYAWSRHPSYAGFTWWAVGTQVMLVNPLGTFAFAAVLYYFFSNRIKTEEKYLIQFFGDEYVQYRQRVPTRIPFVW